jgi:hypothetical protein
LWASQNSIKITYAKFSQISQNLLDVSNHQAHGKALNTSKALSIKNKIWMSVHILEHIIHTLFNQTLAPGAF